MERTLTIRNSKTVSGERVLPLNDDAWAVVLELYGRAKAMGLVEGNHYLFFSCEVAQIDPSRPMKSWRTAWRRLTRAVTCPECRTLQDPGSSCINEECGADIQKQKSPFMGLRFHDLRHAAITELAERSTSDAVIRSIAGHVNPKMLEHYSHARILANRIALDGLSMRPSPAKTRDGMGGYDTNHDAKRVEAFTPSAQVVDLFGGAERDRTADLLVANEALSQLSYSPTRREFPVYQPIRELKKRFGQSGLQSCCRRPSSVWKSDSRSALEICPWAIAGEPPPLSP